jgi:hypothetical protein
MFDFWSDRPWWMRLIVAFGVMGYGVYWIVCSIHGTHHKPDEMMSVDDLNRYQLLVGFAITGIGFGLAMVSGRTDSEKNGYKF